MQTLVSLTDRSFLTEALSAKIAVSFKVMSPDVIILIADLKMHRAVVSRYWLHFEQTCKRSWATLRHRSAKCRVVCKKKNEIYSWKQYPSAWWLGGASSLHLHPSFFIPSTSLPKTHSCWRNRQLRTMSTVVSKECRQIDDVPQGQQRTKTSKSIAFVCYSLAPRFWV